MKSQTDILILGGTGFIGRNLVNRFIRQKQPVTIFTRQNPDQLKKSKYIHYIQGDLNKFEDMKLTLDNFKTIYYLVHAIDQNNAKFASIEKNQAMNVARNLNHHQSLIFLGGLGESHSSHMKSRKKVGEILRTSPAKISEVQASIIIGNGSASYELIKAMCFRLPFALLTPWSQTLAQPIHIDQVTSFLTDLSSRENVEKNNIYQIGGKNVLSYYDLIVQYADLKQIPKLEIETDKIPLPLVKLVIPFFFPELKNEAVNLLESITCQSIVTEENAIEKPGTFISAIKKEEKRKESTFLEYTINLDYIKTQIDKNPLLRELARRFNLFVE